MDEVRTRYGLVTGNAPFFALRQIENVVRTRPEDPCIRLRGHRGNRHSETLSFYGAIWLVTEYCQPEPIGSNTKAWVKYSYLIWRALLNLRQIEAFRSVMRLGSM